MRKTTARASKTEPGPAKKKVLAVERGLAEVNNGKSISHRDAKRLLLRDGNRLGVS